MAREFARGFYDSTQWKRCREEFRKSKRYLCEDCLSKGILTLGTVVHHKTPLTPENINDPEITLNFDNLKLLCVDCHADEHAKREGRRYRIEKDGTVVAIG